MKRQPDYTAEQQSLLQFIEVSTLGEPKSIVPEEIAEQAESFYLTAMKLMELKQAATENLKKGNTDKKTFTRVLNTSNPAIVCHAFAVELAFKAVILYKEYLPSGEFKRLGHNLNKIFCELRLYDESGITNAIIDIVAEKLKWPVKDKKRLFNFEINRNSNSFEIWRYIFEKPNAVVSYGFLKALYEAIKEAVPETFISNDISLRLPPQS